MSTTTYAARPVRTRSTVSAPVVPRQRCAVPGGDRAVVAPARAARPAAARSECELRLTRRGRVVVTVVLLVAVLAALTLFSGQSAASGERGDATPTVSVVVGDGDTLWDLAGQVGREGDLREVVHEIKRLNALSDSTVFAGQVLMVPTR